MKLNRLFSDGAVFQRRAPIAVFGTTEPNSVVSVRLNGNESRGAAGLDGSFLIDLAPMEAGGPYTMTVRNLRTGDETEVRDILIGEVWLASGQSNMQFRMNESPLQMQEFLDEHKGKPDIRMFTVKQRASCAPEHDVQGSWLKSDDPAAVAEFSAVALWYAADLHEKLGVPVGILASSWGGTIAEAWTSRNTLLRNPEQHDLALNTQFLTNRPKRWEDVDIETFCPPPEFSAEKLAEAVGPLPPNTGFERGWAKEDFNDIPWREFEIPNSWIDEGVCLNGSVWIRREIILPPAWAGKDLVLHLGGIDKQDITYFNGEEIGRTGKDYEIQYWGTKREYRIPARLVKAGRNVIAIRGLSFVYDGSLNGKAADYFVELPGCADTVSVAGPARIQVEHDIGRIRPDKHSKLENYGPHVSNTPSVLFDSIIRPLIPYGIRGAIWYQGESNSSNAEQYGRLIKDLITDWRFHWGIGDFPFIQVGLASYDDPKVEGKYKWPIVRQAQLEAACDLPNCGMIPAVDIGAPKDIHPKNKREVGRRLSEWALRNVYFLSQGVRECAPQPREMRIEGRSIRVIFDNAASGLVLRQGAPEGGFLLSGYHRDLKVNNAWHPAKAVIEGSSVVLTAPELDHPRRVRYAWLNNLQELTLFNGDGLPAVPFEM